MTKAPDAFRSIGEVSRLIGVAPHVLRYWEGQFPQLSPVKRADGRRYYRPDDVRLAAGLCQVMREDGLSIRGAKRLIAEDRGAGLRQIGAARLGALLDPAAGQAALSGPVVRLAVPQEAPAAEASDAALPADAAADTVPPAPELDAATVAQAKPAPPAPAAPKPASEREAPAQLPFDLDAQDSPDVANQVPAADASATDSHPAPDDSADGTAQSHTIPASDWLEHLDRVLDKLQSRRSAPPQAAAALRDALKTAL